MQNPIIWLKKMWEALANDRIKVIDSISIIHEKVSVNLNRINVGFSAINTCVHNEFYDKQKYKQNLEN